MDAYKVDARTASNGQHANVLVPNIAAKGIPYFTPAQKPVAGSAQDQNAQSAGVSVPKLFQPLKLRGLTLQNRILLSPLCQYSAEDGHQTDWHFAHLGGIISRGPGLSFVEATSVVPEGRITPEDCGLWKDSQIEPLKRIVTFAHSQGQLIGIQLAHAGRKASTVAPWLSLGRGAGPKTKSVNGWESEGITPVHGWSENLKAPSSVPYKLGDVVPKEMSLKDIQELKEAWAAAVRRALQAGFDVIELHGAHGYLIHEFLSPISNKRTDGYGGSFENRIRLALELVDITRKIVPANFPIFFRVSGSDWLEHLDEPSWTVKDTIRLADLLADHGVDLLDVSSAGIDPRQKIVGGPAYQAPFAKEIKKALGDKILVGAVGAITNGKQADELLMQGLDVVLAGRLFQKNPGLVWQFADDVGVQINNANQIKWGFGGVSLPRH